LGRREQYEDQYNYQTDNLNGFINEYRKQKLVVPLEKKYIDALSLEKTSYWVRFYFRWKYRF